LSEGADASELGYGAGDDNDGLARSGDDRRAHEHEVARVQWRRVRIHGVRHPRHRLALSGQGRVVHGELVGLDDPGVGGDRVAGFEHQHVAGHELHDRDLAPFAVAHDPAHVGHQGTQRFRGAFGGVLLREPDDRVEDDDAQDGERQLAIADIARRA
jgi:hypothetical protein